MKLIPVILIAALAALPASAIQYRVTMTGDLNLASAPSPETHPTLGTLNVFAFQFLAEFASEPIGYEALLNGADFKLAYMRFAQGPQGGGVAWTPGNGPLQFQVGADALTVTTPTFNTGHGHSHQGISVLGEFANTVTFSHPNHPGIDPYLYTLENVDFSIVDTSIPTPEDGSTILLGLFAMAGTFGARRLFIS